MRLCTVPSLWAVACRRFSSNRPRRLVSICVHVFFLRFFFRAFETFVSEETPEHCKLDSSFSKKKKEHAKWYFRNSRFSKNSKCIWTCGIRFSKECTPPLLFLPLLRVFAMTRYFKQCAPAPPLPSLPLLRVFSMSQQSGHVESSANCNCGCVCSVSVSHAFSTLPLHHSHKKCQCCALKSRREVFL